MKKNEFNYEKIAAAFERKKYAFFRGDNNINIFGIRDRNGNVDEFCDLVGVAYESNGRKLLKLYEATTKAGKYYLNNPMNGKATAIIKEGQYRGAFSLGTYNGYRALRQNSALLYYNDGNRDSVPNYDEKTLQWGNRGTHLHKAGKDSTVVGKWSAGCQVLAKEKDYEELIAISEKAAKKYGNSFTYTLLKLEEI